MLEFEIGAYRYRARKLDTFKQMHLLKRVGPPFIKLMRAEVEAEARKPVAPQVETESEKPDPLATAMATMDEMEKVLAALNELSDEQSDFVIVTCATVVQRQIPSNSASPVWGPIFEPRSKTFMFEDLANLGDIMQICSAVVRDNLSGFLAIRSPGNNQVVPIHPTLAASNM